MEDATGLDLVVGGTGEAGYWAWVILWRNGAEVRRGPYAIRGSFDRLDGLADQPKEYNRCLSETIFANRALLDGLRWGMEVLQGPTRAGDVSLRLCLEPYNSPLQRLRWELLGYPSGGLPLVGQDNLLFSRLVPPAWPEPDPRPRVNNLLSDPARLPGRPRDNLQALFASANPGSLARMGLAPVNAQQELDRSGLNGIGFDIFPAFAQPGERCTLEGLADRLLASPDARPYDLLYLVCHARFDRRQPYLYFADQAGGARLISGSVLANRLQGVCPRLVVMAHPVESHPFAGQAAMALGALLARDLACTVLVLPGSLAPHLLPGLLRRFFAGVDRNSRPDLALAQARRALVGRNPGWWQPVLFSSRRDCRLWEQTTPP